MAITRTRTATKTFTRVVLIKLQVDRILSRCDIDSDTIMKIFTGIDEKWIQDVHVYGLDSTGQCWAELHVKIDWERNQLHVTAGREQVSIDSRWRDDIAIEVEKTLGLFEEYCKDKSLRFNVHVRYRSGVNVAHANSRLGFVAAERVRWAGEYFGSAMSVPEIDEFSIGINLV
jgi:hypothetical protein